MAHFCWLLKFGFLLLMLSGCWTRPSPLPGSRQSELIAGNEFLKLFLDHDDQQRSLHSGEQDFEGRGESAHPRQRVATGRSLNTSRNRYRNSLGTGTAQETQEKDTKQVVKLVTSGSKIVFLEDTPKTVKEKSSDEVKVVAVSVSSSSKRGPPPATGSGTDFVNRSHKSELSIEEAEPRLAADSMDAVEVDSLNSASNIQSVLAAPLLAASASTTHMFVKNQSEINEEETGAGTGAGLPFQTVIYHDTKQGRGPQSRSISYSSISQNVDDLQTWQQSRSGILAEAQRNVSESLKHGHASEPAKFYSVPSKMYSVPSKFYSEPAKVYSEPSKMYGQPEKVYSEPAKVYGQPSKFYSEPAKVYSQPSKVYGEPAKTYWPQTVSSSTAATPLVSTTSHGGFSTTSSTTEIPPVAATTFVPPRSRPRPAIVSRIAFGEAQSTTTAPAPVASTAPTSSSTAATLTSTPAAVASRVTTVKPPSSTVKPTTWQHHYHSYNHQQSHQQQQAHPTRRVLFNLDKLPYDLLNAPQPHLLEPILSKHSSPSNYQQHQQQQLQQQQQQQQQNPCWEQRQHSSLPHQHSNQNAKRLPNRDLVKCISKFAHQHGGASASVDPSATSTGTGGYSYSSSSSSSSSTATASSSSSSSSSSSATLRQQQQQHFTTERPELYTPTSEQNYEIEESVSVMTNGRAHGPQGGGAGIGGAVATTPASPATTTTTPSAASGRGINRGRGSVVYNANANDYSDGSESDGEGGDVGGGGGGGSDSADEDEDKVAYVVEGRNYRKYRVEEKTDDGFIVGEYGVVDHNDGNLWGVRYTADSTINRSLIQKALLTFLKLK
ncbi:uncharacterized protein Dana_GF22926, isoform B [Drosophila ananassae]|uniref:Uncharacterized protein, isoform A n=1 Tax=Drosophila ananassae TaxID=7217 RepID=B3MT77_DROAN|nr:mucin-5AC [Drosophila ananassae]XP_032305425.1 mucin-5AC [Drosophila ananassae]EDV30467.1 uncharacterized protein Dana_GF22926, isoform A [Drosophila ananassae]KPU72878.1 uncharacterized protein Dana_GF22926, isoform B [Drosophila ananassae]